jgi:malate/lactate dehydrogenase
MTVKVLKEILKDYSDILEVQAYMPGHYRDEDVYYDIVSTEVDTEGIVILNLE